MKIFYLLIFIILSSCSTVQKTYMCGDRQCVDKREFNEYFAKNLTIEIAPVKNKVNKKVDLVMLNTDASSFKKKDKINLKKEEKEKKKIEKERLKVKKIQLLEERKIKKSKEMLIKKNEKQMTKISTKKLRKLPNEETDNFSEKSKNIFKKIISEKSNKKKVANKEVQVDYIKNQNTKTVCDKILDCDIDKIAEILSNKGKNKPYPNITSK